MGFGNNLGCNSKGLIIIISQRFVLDFILGLNLHDYTPGKHVLIISVVESVKIFSYSFCNSFR